MLFWIAASSVWCVSASTRLGATFDEPTYITLGLESWRTGSSKSLLDLGTMPLPPHVQTLPLHLWERWRGEQFDIARDLHRMLPAARLGTLLFWWILLLYGWRAGRQLAGPWGGRLAIVFLACEPNLLAHAGLATTDVAVSACLLALLYHFRVGRGEPWHRRVLVPAAWFALAVLTKASGLVFGVIGLCMVEVQYQSQTISESGLWRRFRAMSAALFARPFRRDLASICTLGLIAVFCYCGSDWLPSPSFVKWAHQLPEGQVRSAMVWFAEHLCIFSNAGMALVRQFRHNVQGHGVFLLDQVERRAIWYYFPLALSIKSPLPLLVAPLMLAGICRRALWNWAFAAALALLGFSLVCRVQTGIRLMLPLIALAVVGLAAALVIARERLAQTRWRPVLTASCVLSGAWLFAASLIVWPEGLCYTNELWGGTANGYRCLSDSNYDWGQGLKELTAWQQEHQVDDLHVLYYGTDSTLKHLPMKPLKVGALDLGPDDLPMSVQGGTLAVGTSIVYGSVSETFPDLRILARSLRRLTPVDRTPTFLIYRFPPPDALAEVGGAEP
ncbi:MAG TPA: glycosyltransferase family 39 protein [Gemmataceae bacterium]